MINVLNELYDSCIVKLNQILVQGLENDIQLQGKKGLI